MSRGAEGCKRRPREPRCHGASGCARLCAEAGLFNTVDHNVAVALGFHKEVLNRIWAATRAPTSRCEAAITMRTASPRASRRMAAPVLHVLSAEDADIWVHRARGRVLPLQRHVVAAVHTHVRVLGARGCMLALEHQVPAAVSACVRMYRNSFCMLTTLATDVRKHGAHQCGCVLDLRGVAAMDRAAAVAAYVWQQSGHRHEQALDLEVVSAVDAQCGACMASGNVAALGLGAEAVRGARAHIACHRTT
mmetsp:Transcript_70495/g.210189  ORF Transcript_70495/g.210189 Transcript_70495/m.210189 type:complete len:249 (+) Transcript_70495:253-999(+)